jgi:hypothetical protein
MVPSPNCLARRVQKIVKNLKINYLVKLFIVLFNLYTSNHFKKVHPGNTKGGSITVLLTSCLTGLESAV